MRNRSNKLLVDIPAVREKIEKDFSIYRVHEIAYWAPYICEGTWEIPIEAFRYTTYTL